MTDDLPFDPFPDADAPAEDKPARRRPGRPRGSGRTKTLAEANEVPDLAYVVWRQQEDVDGKPYVLVMEATVDPLRALELLELNRGAFVESVDLT